MVIASTDNVFMVGVVVFNMLHIFSVEFRGNFKFLRYTALLVWAQSNCAAMADSVKWTGQVDSSDPGSILVFLSLRGSSEMLREYL